MSSDGFEVYLGRIRSPSGARKAKGFLRRVSRSVRPGRSAGRRSSGRGQRSNAQTFQRRVMVKMHIVRLNGIGAAAQRLHLSYIQRDSAARENEHGHIYNALEDEADAKAFEQRGHADRHQFRVIVSPEDARAMVALKPFIRDLMMQMEMDLDTKLDWVAANHFNTDYPHTHIVIGGKREDGSDLVIPKRYCFEGLRLRAQELITLELGPVTQLEARKKQAMSIRQERFIQIDRELLKTAENGIVDLSAPYKNGQAWKRQLERARLKILVNLNLAEKLGRQHWKLNKDLENTLKRMGERGDIIKTMHRVMAETGFREKLDANSIFDPQSESSKPVTGKVIAKGIADDVSDKAYLVIESVDGKTVYVDIGRSDALAYIEKGMIVTASAREFKPRPSDHTLAKIAAHNNGRYSPALHIQSEPDARAEFVDAHVRRLEALRRGGVVKRNVDGSWQLPPDYLKKVVGFEKSKMRNMPVFIDIKSRQPLENLIKVIGSTWLDDTLRDAEDRINARGFGRNVEMARNARRMFLREQGIIGKDTAVLKRHHLDELERRDLKNAGENLESKIGKPYRRMEKSGRVSGIYSASIDRPSGKYAIIERAKDFTLVPWRGVLQRNQGKMVSGIVRGGKVSWTLSKGRGLS